MRKEGAVSLRNNPCFIGERWQNDRLCAKNCLRTLEVVPRTTTTLAEPTILVRT